MTVPNWLPDWKDEKAYPAGNHSTSMSQWAWEFLRRYPQYQTDFSSLKPKELTTKYPLLREPCNPKLSFDEVKEKLKTRNLYNSQNPPRITNKQRRSLFSYSHHFPDYLRILDGRSSGVTFGEIGKTIYQSKSEDPEDAAKKAWKKAQKLCGNSIEIALAENKAKALLSLSDHASGVGDELSTLAQKFDEELEELATVINELDEPE